MNDQTPTSAQRAEALQGMGCKRKRVEDIRFVQGKGSYVDDMKLPGMLYGDLVRSPHAHARVKKIDTAKASAVPGFSGPVSAAPSCRCRKCRGPRSTPCWRSRELPSSRTC